MDLRYHSPLTEAEQRAHGIETPQRIAMADRVRFAELDTNNHVNNKAYFGWFETLRVEYGMRVCHGHFDRQPRVVLRSAEMRFYREMYAGDSYIATAACLAFRTSSYTLRQQVWSDGTLCAVMDCVMVNLDPAGTDGARMPLPDSLTEDFIRLDGAVKEG